MLKIDPHTHSSCSDGTDSPSELMDNARLAGLDVVGLTDHDTTAGWAESAKRVDDTGVSLIRGVEISCASEGITVHLLGYLMDPNNDSFRQMIDRTRHSRLGRAQKMVENLSRDYDITWEKVRSFAPGDDMPIGRPHIADALVAVGAFPDRSAAFERVLHPSGPYYTFHWAPDPVEAVHVVREAGGIPVLAHPRARKRQKLLPEEVIDAMAEGGLFGIERDHRDHDARDRADVARIAKRLHLRITGSSDYHGTGKPNHLGENLTSESVFFELESEGYLEVLRP